MAGSADRDRRPPAVVSIDLDSAATHLAGYGIAASEDRLLEVAVPRLLGLLADAGVRATLFVVASDPPPTTLLLEAAEHHEIASHSMTHPMPFARLAAAQLRDETAGARARLEEVVGHPVVGFRAPNWDIGPAAWEALAAGGYRYDASLLPTPWQLAIRTVLSMGARSMRPLTAMSPIPAGWRRRPHRVVTSAGPIWEIPVATTPTVRLPIYHTVRHRLSSKRFERIVSDAAARADPFSYAFHAIDAVAIDDPGIPAALRRHPGMELPLEAKLDELRSTLALIAGHFRPVTGAELVAELEDGRPAVTSRGERDG